MPFGLDRLFKRGQQPASQVASAPPDSLVAANQDPLATAQLGDALPQDGAVPAPRLDPAKTTRKTRLHTATTGDDGLMHVNAAKANWKSNGGTVGGNIGANADIEVNYEEIDATGKWAKAKAGNQEGWVQLDKVKGQDQRDAYAKGDKFYGLSGTSDLSRRGYVGQIGQGHAKHSWDDLPQNADFVNTIAGAGGLKAVREAFHGKRSKDMADSVMDDPKWGQAALGVGMGAEKASQVSLEATKRTMEPGNQIRFLLDDIQSADALAKGKYEHACTSHELRYLHRNRDALKGKTSFYRGDQQVPAPWLTDRKTWENAGKEKVGQDIF